MSNKVIPLDISHAQQKAFQAFKAGQLDLAENIAKSILNQKNKNPNALYILGACAHRKGLPDEALKYLKKSYSADKKNIGTLSTLGTLFFQQSDFAHAIKYFNSAVKITNYKDASLLNFLGLSYQNNKDFRNAEKAFKSALKANPKFPQAYYNLGLLAEGIEDLNKARDYYLKSVELEPKAANLYNKLGDLERNGNNSVAASDYYNQALHLDPKNTLFINNIALLNMDMGDFEKAKNYYRQSLKADPSQTNISIELALLIFNQESKEDALPLFQSAINQSKIQPDNINNDPILAFELGRAHEKLQNYPTAFSFYKAAQDYWKNQLVLNKRDYKPDLVDQDLIKIKKVFSNVAPQREGFGNPAKRPIFIVGMPRSGTSLLEQILASHPDIYGAGELSFIPHIKKEIKAKSKNVINAFGRLSKSQIEKYATYYLDEIEKLSNGQAYVIDKLPINFQNVGLIRLLFPNALIIHNQRNAIDTCLSIYLQNFAHEMLYNHSLADLAHCYKYQCDITDFWKDWDTNIISISYEKLINNQKATTLLILHSLGLEWDEKCLQFYETNRAVKTASHMQVRQPLYNSSINKWKRFKDELAPLISDLGNYINK